MINKDIKIILALSVILTVIFSAVCAFAAVWCGILCFFMGAVLTLVFLCFTKKRFDKLSLLNDYLSLVCAGEYELDIADNAEGELSILKNNLYKVICILRTQNDALKKEKAYLSDSLADISHQLKTPLTSMTVMTDLLTNEKSEEKRNEFIHIMETQLDKMKWLITTLLKISKLDTGTANMKKEDNSSLKIIAASIEPFELMLELKEIKVENTLPEFVMNVDKRWTVEAIQNIIKNCIEHTQHGGSLSISGESLNICNIIRIKDNGCGIAKEDIPHVFERFYHGKNSSSESVGIGLALSKTVLEKQNASVSVASAEGEGTEFEIKFYKAIV